MTTGGGLSIWWRLYIYALHGYFTEIGFTAAWEFVVTYKWTLMGTTSVWTIPIYGISGLIVEQLYLRLTEYRVPLALRGVVYVLWTYCWEFSTGYLLRLFGACPWNYEAYEWDFLGLICLEYAPLWYLASLAYDRILLHYTLHLQWKPARTVGRSKSQ